VPPAPGVPVARTTDPVAVTSLVTAFLIPGPLPIGLGIWGLYRVRRDRTDGRAVAIAGIVLGVVLPLVAVAVVALVLRGGGALSRAQTRAECESGKAAACDLLYRISRDGSEDQAFGNTCGGRTDGEHWCELLPTVDGWLVVTRGDDPELDVLWDDCVAGYGEACDELAALAPRGSEYLELGATCAGRDPGPGACRLAPGPDGVRRPPDPGRGSEQEPAPEPARVGGCEVPRGRRA